MARSRVIRVFAVLVLFLAQAALGLPHVGAGQVGAYAPTADRVTADGAGGAHGAGLPGHMAGAAHAGTRAHGHCEHGTLPGSQREPVPPCSSCPGVPGGPTGGCPAMAGCTPSPASPSALTPVALATVAVTDASPAGLAPAAHDFNPDPPPPRA